jgi:hypothetical protein
MTIRKRGAASKFAESIGTLATKSKVNPNLVGRKAASGFKRDSILTRSASEALNPQPETERRINAAATGNTAEPRSRFGFI